MTERRATTRARRRTAGAAQIPKWIAAWFAGDRPIAFQAASQQHCSRLREYWDAWLAEHPGAIQPENFEVFARAGEAKSRRAASALASTPQTQED